MALTQDTIGSYMRDNKFFTCLFIISFALTLGSIGIAQEKTYEPIETLKADFNLDGKTDTALVQYENKSPCISINNSKCQLFELLGPDNKLLKLKKIMISPKTPLVLVEYHSGSAGTQTESKKSVLYFYRWDGKQPHEVGRFTLLDSYSDPQEKLKIETKTTYKLVDINNDGFKDLQLTTETKETEEKKKEVREEVEELIETHLWDKKLNKFIKKPKG
ncbi:hypothetical protein ACFLRA_01700 [Bdellovibrionota bacterium]